MGGVKIWDEWCCIVPLPVELVEFKGENHGAINIITWITASEINNDYFTLQRSTDALTWSEVYEVAGTNGFNMQHYSFIDSNIQGTYYYRLKQTDFDGTFEYFKVEVVTFRNNKSRRLVFKINTKGQVVSDTYNGVIIKVFSDGTTEKVIN